MNGIGAGINSLGPSKVSIHDRPDCAGDTDHIPCAGFTPTSDKNAWLSKPFRVDVPAQQRTPRPRPRGFSRERQRDVTPHPQQRPGPEKIQSCRCRREPDTTIIGPSITYAENTIMNVTHCIYPVEAIEDNSKASVSNDAEINVPYGTNP